MDTAVLINTSGTGGENFELIKDSFFGTFPLEFDVNQLVSMWKNNELQMMVLDGDRKLSEDPLKIRQLTIRIRGKIAILMTPQISYVPDKRIHKMLSKGFKVISEDKKIRWVDRPTQSENVVCYICREEIESRWLPTQNILFYKTDRRPECTCSKVYICANGEGGANREGCIHQLCYNRCIFCHADNAIN